MSKKAEQIILDNKNGIAKKTSLVLMVIVILISAAVPILGLLIMKNKTPATIIWVPLAIAGGLTILFSYIVADGLRRKAILDFMVTAKNLYPDKPVSSITTNGVSFSAPNTIGLPGR